MKYLAPKCQKEVENGIKTAQKMSNFIPVN